MSNAHDTLLSNCDEAINNVIKTFTISLALVSSRTPGHLECSRLESGGHRHGSTSGPGTLSSTPSFSSLPTDVRSDTHDTNVTLLDTLSEIFLVHVLELGRHRRHSLILLHQPYTCFGCKTMAAVYGVLCGGPNNLSCLINNLSTLSTDADQ